MLESIQVRLILALVAGTGPSFSTCLREGSQISTKYGQK